MVDTATEFPAQLAATNLHGFATLVAEMRRTQTEYFKTRSPVTLRESKMLEKVVDRTLEIINGVTEAQGGLGL